MNSTKAANPPIHHAYTKNKADPGHHMPLQLWQLSSSLLHASEGRHVDKVLQSCQQHIPAGAGAGVDVLHSSSHDATHTANTAGLAGHPSIHADSDPPGQPLGLGVGLGAAVVVAVVVTGQSCLHTEMQMSRASPVTTEQAAIQAPIDPPGQPPEGDGDGGLGETVGVAVVVFGSGKGSTAAHSQSQDGPSHKSHDTGSNVTSTLSQPSPTLI